MLDFAFFTVFELNLYLLSFLTRTRFFTTHATYFFGFLFADTRTLTAINAGRWFANNFRWAYIDHLITNFTRQCFAIPFWVGKMMVGIYKEKSLPSNKRVPRPIICLNSIIEFTGRIRTIFRIFLASTLYLYHCFFVSMGVAHR